MGEASPWVQLPRLLWLALSLSWFSIGSSHDRLTAHSVWQWREDARDALYHAMGSYMRHAYPADELKPLTCTGRWWHTRERGNLDDALGGFSLTLLDSLDTLAMTGDIPAFRCAVSRAVREVRLDRNVRVSVFETTIRVLGGLLSAHLLSVDPALGLWERGCPAGNCTTACMGAPESGLQCPPADCLPRYDGQLLYMADELGRRLLPAFDTPTGMPYHRINLATGEVDPASRDTCTAAAGTYLVEMGLLSRLTGDPTFEAVARKATLALYERRSHLGLIGSAIDAVDGGWRTSHTGIGAGIDSYIEYLLKAGIVLDDDELIEYYHQQSFAASTHLVFGGLHLEVGMGEGRRAPRSPTVSALQAFYPGLEVLSGHVDDAKQHYSVLSALWHKWGALPDGYDVSNESPTAYGRDAPLRPELIESTYHLYTATRDPAYVWLAQRHLSSLHNRSRVDCGFASIADVVTGRLDDRFDSYTLAETFKYLFVIFDTALKHWYSGPVLGPSWPSPPSVDRRQLLAQNHSSSRSWSVAVDVDAEAAAVDKAVAPLTAAAAAVEYYNDRLSSLHPGAHFLTFVRRDNYTGGVDAVASLPLREDNTIFTTEGHVIPLGYWPATPVGPSSAAAKKPASTAAKSKAAAGSKTPSRSLQPDVQCPRMLPHTHASHPAALGSFAEAVTRQWSEARLTAVPKSAEDLKQSLRGQACYVSRLKGAVHADHDQSVALAIPPGLDSMAVIDQHYANLLHAQYPIVGSHDLVHGVGSDTFDRTVAPAIRAAVSSASAEASAAAAAAGGGAQGQQHGALHAASQALAKLQQALQSMQDSLLGGNSGDGGGDGDARQQASAGVNVISAKSDGTHFTTNGWVGSALFPANIFINALNRAATLKYLLELVVLQCEPSRGVCQAHTSLQSRAPQYVLRLHPQPGQQVTGPFSRLFASSAQFGPVFTALGLRGVTFSVADPLMACSPLSRAQAGSVVLVLRGGCTFVEKARNAQNAGAVGVLILADTRMSSNDEDPALPDEGPPYLPFATAFFVMSDDGHGGDIHIPAAYLPVSPSRAFLELLPLVSARCGGACGLADLPAIASSSPHDLQLLHPDQQADMMMAPAGIHKTPLEEVRPPGPTVTLSMVEHPSVTLSKLVGEMFEKESRERPASPVDPQTLEQFAWS